MGLFASRRAGEQFERTKERSVFAPAHVVSLQMDLKAAFTSKVNSNIDFNHTAKLSFVHPHVYCNERSALFVVLYVL